jgi:hypothetical protein
MQTERFGIFHYLVKVAFIGALAAFSFLDIAAAGEGSGKLDRKLCLRALDAAYTAMDLGRLSTANKRIIIEADGALVSVSFVSDKQGTYGGRERIIFDARLNKVVKVEGQQ